jgi:hypothetical protein
MKYFEKKIEQWKKEEEERKNTFLCRKCINYMHIVTSEKYSTERCSLTNRTIFWSRDYGFPIQGIIECNQFEIIKGE